MNRGTNDAVRQAASSAIDAQVRRAKVCEECGQLEGLGPHFLGCSQAGRTVPPGGAAPAASSPGATYPDGSETCQACEGTGQVMVDSMLLVGVPGGMMPDRCDECGGKGWRETQSETLPFEAER